MENQQTLSVSLKQQQQLTGTQLQSLELLARPLLELQETLNAAAAENPLLEIELPSHEVAQELPPEISAAAENSGDDDAWSADLCESGQWDSGFPDDGGMNSNPDDNARHDYLIDSFRSSEPSVQEQLERELALTGAVPDGVRRAAEAIIDGIDERGYLTVPEADLVMSLNLPPETVQRALALVQSFDPPGIGARNLGECLLLQLRRAGDLDAVTEEILRHHLSEIEANHLPQLAKKLNISVPELNEKIARLKNLDPFPGRRLQNDDDAYVIPEAEIAEEEDGSFHAAARTGIMPKLFLADRYVKMLDQPDLAPETKNYLKEKIAAAREFMHSYELRQSTVLRIAELIARTQSEFFRHGEEALKPLTMREAGKMLDLHETTVSRAVAGKYLKTPRGVFPFRHFFPQGVTAENGTEVTAAAVKEKIRELIRHENAQKPLSDDAIAKILKDSGCSVARRTVAKYRESMNILPTNLRRKHV